MMHGLDSSVVLRLLIGEPEAQARRAMLYLDKLAEQNQRATVSDLVVAEVYFALQHHYKVPKKEALQALHDFLASPLVINDGKAFEVLATPRLESAKPGFVDRMIHLHYTANHGQMATFEKAAKKLENVEIL